MTPAPAVWARCDQYLDRLGLAPERRQHLYSSIDWTDCNSEREAMARLHHALAGPQASDTDPAYGSVAARLPSCTESASIPLSNEQCADKRSLPIAPPLNRGSMVPHPWGVLNPVKRRLRDVFRRHNQAPGNAYAKALQTLPATASVNNQDDVVDSPDPRGNWQYPGNIRRLALLVLMLAQTTVATHFMAKVLPYQGTKLLEIAVLALFAILFCWVSAGFWTAIAGFLVMLRGTDLFAITRRSAGNTPIDPGARTAIVMPICNEDVPRVMAGLRATYESIAKTGELERFDFFVLSDSTESDTCTSEVAAWSDLCRTVNGFGRIFYRRRQRRVKRKSGNIDDFCRRWGNNYRYMIVLDADSIMSGSCVTTLVRLMEANPAAGIIQTAPRAVGRDTLYARIQQFATSVYGPLFTAGLHYWQLGESHYWGHNAIIRVAPFMAHCALAPLPGRGSLSGEILSHDFVEAALMRRAGWAVWIAYDLDGSYEEMPPNLLDELKRDRRWCHGNLMNFRLFGAQGMHPVHRAVFVTGVMAYLSAPLWFASLALATALLAFNTLVPPEYFVEPRQLFPIWPQWDPEKAIALFGATATLLLLPKLLAVTVICVRNARQFGGHLRVILSALAEMLFSMLLAPVRMLFHTHFVVAAFLGWAIHWKSPPRHDSETSWGQAFRMHGAHQLLGLLWGAGVFWLNPSFLPWLLPIAGSLLLAVPVSVLSSRVSLGRRLRIAKLFAIPEEINPPPEVQAAIVYAGATREQAGVIDAVVDPQVNALICASSRPRRAFASDERDARAKLADTILSTDPAALPETSRQMLLKDPLLLSQLHLEVWSSERAHAGWREHIGFAA